MELIVAHFIDPMTTVIVVECQDCPIRLSQVPYSNSAIGTTCCHGMQSALVVSQVKHLINMSDEVDIALLACLFTKINNAY